LSAPPDPLAAIGGSTSKGRRGEREGRGGGRERERRGRRREGEGKGAPPLLADHFNHCTF